MKTNTLRFALLSGILFLSFALFAGCNKDGTGTEPSMIDNSSAGLEKGGPSTPPANPAITYVDSRGIIVMNADGTNITSLSISGSRQSWSPDGSKMAMIYFPSGGPGGIYTADISIVNGTPRASNLRFLVSGYDPEWSPLGDEIAYRNTDGTQILVVPSGGGTPTALVTVLYDTSMITRPTWRGDGSKIAFVEAIFHGNNPVPWFIRVLDRPSGTVTTALSAGTSYLFNPDWARTGDKLAYEIYIGGIVRIYTLDLVSLTASFIANGNYPSWSPDDSKLVYNNGRDINTINLTTGAVQLLKRNGGSYLAWKR